LRGVTAAGAVVLASLAFSACGGSGRDSAPAGSLTLEQARRLVEFPLLYAGDQVAGLPLTAVLRRGDTADYVSFVYGDCVPRDDAGCAPPAEIQVWPSCRRSLVSYDERAPARPSVEWLTVRGVPAALLDGGTRLELQTGTSTVVVFASTPARAATIGAALRPLGSGATGAALPPPLAGAPAGAVEC
jgi:hypothetical protein